MPARPSIHALLSRLPYPLRMAGITALFSSVIGLLVYGFTRNQLLVSIVYSVTTGLLCWSLIDGSRVLSAALMRRLRPEREEHRHHWPGWPVMLACVLVSVPLAYSLGHWLADQMLGQHRTRSLWNNHWREIAGMLLVSLLASVVATGFFYARGRLSASRAEAEQARRQAAEMQLRLLESQLEPHMLFNTLANLRVLIALDPPRAQAMLDQLIAFLRATLNASRSGAHPLREEFARLGDYLALMQLRMGTRLQPQLILPEELAGLAIPPLLLQPLVENAIQHGLEPHVEGGALIISAARERGQLLLQVRDTGAGLGAVPSGGTGFGLAQVRARLATQYGGRASLQVASAADARGGTLVSLRLPLTE